MGKRSDFQRRKNDVYDTPYEATLPLLRFLPPATRFVEPCAGAYDLAFYLELAGHVCVAATDIEPRDRRVAAISDIGGAAGLDIHQFGLGEAAYFITNPPFTFQVLAPIIRHLMALRPTWMLLEADWKHNQRAHPYMLRCAKVVSIGRVKWIPGSTATGKQNYAWYLFDDLLDGPTEFHGRAA